MNKTTEHELAVALEKYTDPTHPEYDAEFDAQIRMAAPHWFEETAHCNLCGATIQREKGDTQHRCRPIQ